MKFSTWKDRLEAAADMPVRIRYTRKSREQEDRQAASHDRQNEEMDKEFGAIEPRWIWKDSHTGTTFDRPDFNDLVQFCMENPRPKSDPGVIEMYAPSRFGRVVDEEGQPDMLLYLKLKCAGWDLRFVTLKLTGKALVDYGMICVYAHLASSSVSVHRAYNTRLLPDHLIEKHAVKI